MSNFGNKRKKRELDKGMEKSSFFKLEQRVGNLLADEFMVL